MLAHNTQLRAGNVYREKVFISDVDRVKITVQRRHEIRFFVPHSTSSRPLEIRF